MNMWKGTFNWIAYAKNLLERSPTKCAQETKSQENKRIRGQVFIWKSNYCKNGKRKVWFIFGYQEKSGRESREGIWAMLFKVFIIKEIGTDSDKSLLITLQYSSREKRKKRLNEQICRRTLWHWDTERLVIKMAKEIHSR